MFWFSKELISIGNKRKNLFSPCWAVAYSHCSVWDTNHFALRSTGIPDASSNHYLPTSENNVERDKLSVTCANTSQIVYALHSQWLVWRLNFKIQCLRSSDYFLPILRRRRLPNTQGLSTCSAVKGHIPESHLKSNLTQFCTCDFWLVVGCRADDHKFLKFVNTS